MDYPQRRARQEETRAAKQHGGRVTPASGSLPGVKNDVRNDEWSFEVKSTQNLSYPLTRAVLDSAEKNALSDSRKMALIVSFVPKRFSQARAKRFVVLTEDDFIELTGGESHRFAS